MKSTFQELAVICGPKSTIVQLTWPDSDWKDQQRRSKESPKPLCPASSAVSVDFAADDQCLLGSGILAGACAFSRLALLILGTGVHTSSARLLSYQPGTLYFLWTLRGLKGQYLLPPWCCTPKHNMSVDQLEISHCTHREAGAFQT